MTLLGAWSDAMSWLDAWSDVVADGRPTPVTNRFEVTLAFLRDRIVKQSRNSGVEVPYRGVP